MPRRSRSRDRSRSRSANRDDRHRHRRSSPPPPARRRRSRSRDRDRDSKEDVERLNPTPSKVLGVFGLSSQTDERGLKRVFSKFGRVNNVHIVYDRGTGRSRGFGFIYFDKIEDARDAKKDTHGNEIEGQKVRVDFSLTDRPHDRTPGIYMGGLEKRSSHSDHRSSRRHRSRTKSRSRSPRRRSRS